MGRIDVGGNRAWPRRRLEEAVHHRPQRRRGARNLVRRNGIWFLTRALTAIVKVPGIDVVIIGRGGGAE